MDRVVVVRPTSLARSVTSDPAAIAPVAPGPMQPETAGEQLPGQPMTTPVDVLINEDPLRARVRNPPSRKLIPRIGRFLRAIIAREPTGEEVGERADRARAKALEKVLLADSKTAVGRMQKCLTRLGICYIRRKADGTARTIRQVKFDQVMMGEHRIDVHVDSDHLPFGVSIAQLVSEDTVTNLAVSVGHKITASWTEECGVWYTIERASGTMGLPAHVSLPEMWERIPASRDSLTIPIGMGANSKPIYQSLDEMVHLLIAGTTGGGKSNFLNVILCTLLRRNTPAQLELLLVDLKGGLEFNYYGSIPHLKRIPIKNEQGEDEYIDGIVYDRTGVEPLLDWVISYGEKRMALLLNAGCRHIGEYNSHNRKNKLAQMVVVIDEWADVKLNKGGKEIEDKLANAVQRMRAVGIHVIVCTQVPQSQVIGTLIKANLPAKFAFNCADLQGSMSILNNGAALNLSPRGRCVYRFQDQTQVQTPFISKNLILETIEGAKSGTFGVVKETHDVTQDEVKLWAVRENNGWIVLDNAYAKYKSRRIPREELAAWFRSWETERHLIGSSVYIVQPAEGTRGRRLVVDDK